MNKANFQIDKSFVCRGNIQISLDLNGMTWSDTNSNNGKIRRLSTEHQKYASKEFLFLTLWKWFWMENGIWINYEAEVPIIF